jgi:hypothetical protein
LVEHDVAIGELGAAWASRAFGQFPNIVFDFTHVGSVHCRRADGEPPKDVQGLRERLADLRVAVLGAAHSFLLAAKSGQQRAGVEKDAQ